MQLMQAAWRAVQQSSTAGRLGWQHPRLLLVTLLRNPFRLLACRVLGPNSLTGRLPAEWAALPKLSAL